MGSITDNYRRVWERIERAAERSGRSASEVTVIAVTKGVPVDRIREAAESGLRVFGENYVQEAKAKVEACGKGVSWHMIGHVQRNKARQVVHLFEMIHTLDSRGLAEILNRHAQEAGKRLRVLVQVNISGEPSKFGVSPEEVMPLVEDIVGSRKCLCFCGLMTMAPFFAEPGLARPYFQALRRLGDSIAESLGSELSGRMELSMGMSGDFEVAVEEGATMVRIGTALFGERSYRK